jgi:hypothetical protein
MNWCLFAWCVLLPSSAYSAYRVGVGISDVTGPAAEIGMVSILKSQLNKTEKYFSNLATSQFYYSRSNKSTTTLQF